MSAQGEVSRAVVNPMDLTGRSILVTGGSSGIGRGTAIRLSELGARVVVTGRSRERLDETLSLLAGEGHSADAFDLSQVEEIPAWLEKLARNGGPFDGIVHSAGVSHFSPLRVLSVKAIREVMSVNVETGFLLARGFRRKGVSNPGGCIVYVSSVAAVRAQPGMSAYAASKGAILSITKTLAAELAGDGIRVNCVVPAFVETPMYEQLHDKVPAEQFERTLSLHRLGAGKPVDVANAICFLLSGAARWITGEAISVDGGYLA